MKRTKEGKNGKKYDFIYFQKIDLFIEERAKYEKKPIYDGSCLESDLPQKVDDLTKQEILDFLKLDSSYLQYRYLIIAASPVIDKQVNINGKNYNFSMSSTLESFVDIAKVHRSAGNYIFSLNQTLDAFVKSLKVPQNNVLFTGRSDVLPPKIGGLTNQDVTMRFGEIIFAGYYSYLLITDVV